MFVCGVVLAGTFAAPANGAPAKTPVTTEQFVATCKKDASFCKVQIVAVLLQKNHSACLPAGVSRDAMAAKVEDLVEDVVEEDPDTFRDGPYRSVIDQVISFLWPCEPIS
jgi:hypothetical protein